VEQSTLNKRPILDAGGDRQKTQPVFQERSNGSGRESRAADAGRGFQ
jgi:hypothetical protein